MNRRERQSAILRLVRDRALSTQAELVQALRDEGHEVVQTTVSRDVTELGLVKVRAPSGRLIYAAPGTGDADRLRAI
jgi:transcriptional regulator of arginine metabolism